MRYGLSAIQRKRMYQKIRQGQFGYGDVWTWTAIDADTKLVPSWLVSDRTACAATEFIKDLAGRLSNRIQLTTDGHKAYLEAVEDAFGTEIDYAMLVKLYGKSPETPEKRYSPAKCAGSIKSTSYAEILIESIYQQAMLNGKTLP